MPALALGVAGPVCEFEAKALEQGARPSLLMVGNAPARGSRSRRTERE